MASHFKELSPAPRSRIHIPLIILAAAACALALEIGTLFGARTSSVLDLSAWDPKRMLAFFVFALPICMLIATADWKQFSENASSAIRANGKTAGLTAVALAGTALAVWLLAPPALRALGIAPDSRLSYFAIGTIAMSTLLIVFRKSISQEVEWGFLIISLTAGIMLTVTMPPFAVVSWDGHIHFATANAVSFVRNAEWTGADMAMAEAFTIPEGDYIYEGDFSGAWLPRRDTDSFNRMKADLREREQGEAITITPGTSRINSSSYVGSSMFGRIPNAAGLWLGRLLHLDCIGCYTLGRLISVITYSFVVFYGMRRLRYGKLVLATIGLLPTTLITAANYSYDPFCTGFIALGTTLFVSELQRPSEALKPRTAAIMICSLLLGTSVRAVMFPMLLPLLFMPSSKLPSKGAARLYRIAVVASAAVLFATFALPFLVNTSRDVEQVDNRGQGDLSSIRQLSHILSHPVEYIQLLLTMGRLIVTSVTRDMLYCASYLVRIDSPITKVINYVLLGCIALSEIIDPIGMKSRNQAIAIRLAAIIGCIGYFTLISTALYVGFNAVGSTFISGLQSRYFIPVLAQLALLTFALPRWRIIDGERFGSYAAVVLLALLAVVEIAVVWNTTIYPIFWT